MNIRKETRDLFVGKFLIARSSRLRMKTLNHDEVEQRIPVEQRARIKRRICGKFSSAARAHGFVFRQRIKEHPIVRYAIKHGYLRSCRSVVISYFALLLRLGVKRL